MSAARDAESFIQGLGRPEQVQAETLLERIVRPNTTCEFGQGHGFSSIKTVREYQRRVPVSRYEDFQPSIQRMLGGEPNVLVTEPVRRFFVTSGSSSRPKHVPVTSSFIRDKSRAFAIYWELVFQNHPGNQARARALHGAIARTSGRLLASAAWPGLKLAVFWRSPMLQPYVRLLAPHLSSIAQRDYLSMASEGTMSIPVTDGASGGVLANPIHFYEFVPEADAEKAAPNTCLPHELEVDRSYVIVLST